MHLGINKNNNKRKRRVAAEAAIEVLQQQQQHQHDDDDEYYYVAIDRPQSATRWSLPPTEYALAMEELSILDSACAVPGSPDPLYDDAADHPHHHHAPVVMEDDNAASTDEETAAVTVAAQQQQRPRMPKDLSYLRTIPPGLRDHLVSRVHSQCELEKHGQDNPTLFCTRFTGSGSGGYGRITVPKKWRSVHPNLPAKINAHHVMALALGHLAPVDNPFYVASHLCKNKWCISHQHIVWESNRVNRSRDFAVCPGGDRCRCKSNIKCLDLNMINKKI